MKPISYLIGSLAGTRLASRSPLLSALIIRATARRFHRGTGGAGGRRRVVFIPKTLFREDLVNVFAPDDPDFELWYIAREPLRRLAQVYLPPHLSEYDYRTGDEAIARQKEALRRHWEATLRVLKRLLDPAAFLTCAYYYREEREFAAASLANGIPFVALHKECITTPVTRLARQDVYGRMSGTFTGTLITTYNEEEKATIVTAGCADAAIVDVVGCPRMDPLFNTSPAPSTGAPDVVFFSFSPATYLPVYRRVPRWPSHIDGVPVEPWRWDELYRRFHAFVIRFAAAHPELNVALKVKTGFNVADVVGSQTGTLPANLRIISSGEGGTLAASARAVCGFNSTVLLEALAAKTRVIVPAFAEAALGSMAERYGTLRLGGAVQYARDEGELDRMLADYAAATPDRGRPFTPEERAALERYIGYIDGRSGRRMRDSIARALGARPAAVERVAVAVHRDVHAEH